MTETEAAWLAGILEGEGCFDTVRNDRYPRIRVEMTDYDVIRRVHALTGGTLREVKRKVEWKDSLALTISRKEQVTPVLEAIRPWMGERRGAKIDALLAGQKDVL